MPDDEREPDAVEQLIGRAVVLDMTSPFICLGTLQGQDHRYLVLEDADVHDLRDTHTTRELYALESKRHGVHPNRKRVLIRREEIVGISALDDVVE
ncbi:MAG: hypothetical protein ACE5KM_10210 [Planctomycetaceae bacterium]